MPLSVMKFSLASNWQMEDGCMTPARPAAMESCLFLQGEIAVGSKKKERGRVKLHPSEYF